MTKLFIHFNVFKFYWIQHKKIIRLQNLIKLNANDIAGVYTLLFQLIRADCHQTGKRPTSSPFSRRVIGGIVENYRPITLISVTSVDIQLNQALMTLVVYAVEIVHGENEGRVEQLMPTAWRSVLKRIVTLVLYCPPCTTSRPTQTPLQNG